MDSGRSDVYMHRGTGFTGLGLEEKVTQDWLGRLRYLMIFDAFLGCLLRHYRPVELVEMPLTVQLCVSVTAVTCVGVTCRSCHHVHTLS